MLKAAFNCVSIKKGADMCGKWSNIFGEGGSVAGIRVGRSNGYV
jgi:hypothetical protein